MESRRGQSSLDWSTNLKDQRFVSIFRVMSLTSRGSKRHHSENQYTKVEGLVMSPEEPIVARVKICYNGDRD